MQRPLFANDGIYVKSPLPRNLISKASELAQTAGTRGNSYEEAAEVFLLMREP